MRKKLNEQREVMINALKPRYYVLPWEGGYNLYDTTKPAKYTQAVAIDANCFAHALVEKMKEERK